MVRRSSIDDSGAPIKSGGELLGAVLVFRDITERRRAEQARALLAGIVDSSEDAIVSKSLEGVITSWNHSAEQMFGYTPEEAIGKSIIMIIPTELREEETMILGRLRKGERIEHFETIRVAKTGKRINISLTVSPVRNSQGEIIGASKIARDITDKVHAERELTRLLASERAARERAEAASRAKDEFVAMISHEIRSPLNAILGWSHVLRQGALDKTATANALESIERNARAQAQLVSDLLDVSRVITGKLRINARPVDIMNSLESALESVHPAAEAKQITIDVQREPYATVVTGRHFTIPGRTRARAAGGDYLASMAIVREKELGTLEQLNVTPLRRWELVVGKLFPYGIIAMVDVLLVVAVAVFWFEVPLRGSFLLLLAMSLLYVLCTLALGLFISTISETQQQAMMTATFFFLTPMNLSLGLHFPD